MSFRGMRDIGAAFLGHLPMVSVGIASCQMDQWGERLVCRHLAYACAEVSLSFGCSLLASSNMSFIVSAPTNLNSDSMMYFDFGLPSLSIHHILSKMLDELAGDSCSAHPDQLFERDL